MAESNNTQAQPELQLPIGYWLKRADEVLNQRGAAGQGSSYGRMARMNMLAWIKRGFWGAMVGALVLAVALALSGPATTARAAPGTLVFENVDVFNGEELIPNTVVVVEDGVIRSVGREQAVPAGAERIDGTGKTLLPGMIDAHTHTSAEDHLSQALIFGVTTVLDMFTDHRFAAAMRAEQAANGATHRADLFAAGTLATAVDFAMSPDGSEDGLAIPTLSRPDEARDWVEARIEEGSDYIKLWLDDGRSFGMSLPILSEETLAAVIREAKARGKLTITHATSIDHARTAIQAGTDGLAHIVIDAAPDADLVDLAVDRGIFVITTMVVFQSIGGELVDTSIAEDPHLRPYLTETDLQSLAAPVTGFEGPSLAHAQEAVRRLFRAGIPILAGTDAPHPGVVIGASMHRELVLLVEAGLTPLEALAAATSVPADIFGLNDRGRIAPGYRADLLLVNGDPTEDVTATRDIAGVWKLGVSVDREAYGASLEGQHAATQGQAQVVVELEVVTVSAIETGTLGVGFGSRWAPTIDQLVGGEPSVELEVVR